MDKYSKKIADAIKNYMKSINMKYEFDEDAGVFTYVLRPNSKLGRLCCHVLVDEAAYYVKSKTDIVISDDKIKDISILLNEINSCADFTNFVVDADNMKIYCQCNTNCKGIHTSNEIIAESLFGVMLLVTKYGDFILDVAEGKEINEEALKKLISEKEKIKYLKTYNK